MNSLDGVGPDSNNKCRATFENIKSRGDVAQNVTFEFIKTAGFGYKQLLDSVKRLGHKAVKEADEDAKLHSDIKADKPLVEAILLELAGDEMLTKDIMDKVEEMTTYSRRVIKTALHRWSGDDYDAGHRWTTRKGGKNQVLYQKLPNPVELMVAIDERGDLADDCDS